MTLLDFFSDPVLRAPTLGTIFMSISAALIGVVLLLSKRSLIAESLSHAAYPGVVLTLFILGVFFPKLEEMSFVFAVFGAMAFSYLALKMIHFMEKKHSVKSDSALCFVLALFFGIGIVIASSMQAIVPKMQKKVQMLLLGQAATMTDFHVYLYGALAVFTAVSFFLLYPSLQATIFDREFAKGSKIRVVFVESVCFWLLLVSLILGMRCVGVVLMSAMVIAPSIAARQYTNSLGRMFVLSALFGACSGFLGNVVSVFGSLALSSEGKSIALPTGPMIVLFAALFAFISLVFAPKRGLLFRKMRVNSFHRKCLEENIIKRMWKKKFLSKNDMKQLFPMSSIAYFFVMRRLIRQGWIYKLGHVYHLTVDGYSRASSIVRLHRLWELYLSNMLKVDGEKIHKTAEEMEHILTPEIERHLTNVLQNPKVDPHEQPIPESVL